MVDLVEGIAEVLAGVRVLIDDRAMKIEEATSMMIEIGIMMIEAVGLGTETLVVGKDAVGALSEEIIEAQ